MWHKVSIYLVRDLKPYQGSSRSKMSDNITSRVDDQDVDISMQIGLNFL